MAQAQASAAPAAAPPAARPWTQQWVDAAPVAPVWVGLGIAVAHALSSVVYFAATTGIAPGTPAGDVFWRETFGPACVMGAIMGYSVAAVAYSRRAQRRSLEALRPSLDCSPAEFDALLRKASEFDMRRLRRVGLGFALVLPPLILLNPSAFPWRLEMDYVRHGVAVTLWGLWHNFVSIWLGSRAVSAEHQSARLFSEIGRRYARVDVLDLAPLAPFAHRGLQSVLLFVGGLSLLALIFAGGWAADIAPLGFVIVLASAGLALFLPLRGVHERIHEAKRAQLARLRGEIARDEVDVLDRDAPGCAAAAARLPALLALRERIEAAREWPLDLSNVARFGLYVAIGLGSWLGAALVERALDQALR